MDDLLANNIGDGYCHSWYARRFLSPVEVSDIPKPHAGLGLECYCQWSSPIRRFGDLQVHCAIKRFLRRQAVLEKLESNEDLPSGITALDLGLGTSSEPCSSTTLMEQWHACSTLDSDIDYSDRAGWLRAAKAMQKSSQRYWTLEYIRRMKENEPGKSLQVVVLGCTNPTRRQYALYIYDLGLEWRYISPGTSLQAGMKFRVQVGNVFPRLGQLSLVRVEL
jgi:exoribonuclease R